MVHTAVRSGSLVVFVTLFLACSSPPPAAPVVNDPPVQPMDFPAVSSPARIYAFGRGLDVPTEGNYRSRYVLYDNGDFALQVAFPGRVLESKGSYRQAGGAVAFQWNGDLGSQASGELTGDEMTVRYNLRLSDFQDAVYVRAP